MFSRPFADFDPGPSELEAGRAVREFVIGQVRRGVDARVLDGDETDIAHALLALTLGLASAEVSRGWGRPRPLSTGAGGWPSLRCCAGSGLAPANHEFGAATRRGSRRAGRRLVEPPVDLAAHDVALRQRMIVRAIEGAE